LIRTVQIDKPIAVTDDCNKNEKEENEENEENEKNEENEEKTQYLDEVKPSASYVKDQPRLRNILSLPFKFSVQRTKKLYPCTTCGKQYLERRSLRKHSERVHGVVLPLLRKLRKRWKRTALNKKNFNEANQVFPATSKENNNSEKFYDNKDSRKKITAKRKFTSIETASSSGASSSTISTPFVMCVLCYYIVFNITRNSRKNYFILFNSS